MPTRKDCAHTCAAEPREGTSGRRLLNRPFRHGNTFLVEETMENVSYFCSLSFHPSLPRNFSTIRPRKYCKQKHLFSFKEISFKHASTKYNYLHIYTVCVLNSLSHEKTCIIQQQNVFFSFKCEVTNQSHLIQGIFLTQQTLSSPAPEGIDRCWVNITVN